MNTHFASLILFTVCCCLFLLLVVLVFASSYSGTHPHNIEMIDHINNLAMLVKSSN